MYDYRCVDEVTKKDIRALHHFLLSNIEMMRGVKLEDDMYLNAPNSKERCYQKDYSRSPSPKRYSLGKQNFSEDEDNYYTLKCNYCPNHSVFTCHSRNDLERHEAKVHGYSPHRFVETDTNLAFWCQFHAGATTSLTLSFSGY